MMRAFLLATACSLLSEGLLRAQAMNPASTVPPDARWTPLAPLPDSSITVRDGPALNGNPFAVIGSNALWQETKAAAYTQKVTGNISVTGETTAAGIDLPAQDLVLTPSSQGQRAACQIQPLETVTLSGSVHNATIDGPASSATTGAGFAAQGQLPWKSTLSLSLDHTRTDAAGAAALEADSYAAELHQPLGKVPLTAVVKGGYTETSAGGTTATRLPSLDQALVWKAADGTTLQAGLRQQQYQDFPGINNELNEALYADWSQAVLPGVTWHSYAEMLNTRETQDATPYVATSGTNGTAQSTAPGGGPGLGSVVPVSITNDTLTFSTGPSFNIEKDISASIEYSSRWDQAEVPGAVGSEQRVSVSLKGTF
jgi:hypothetical protein